MVLGLIFKLIPTYGNLTRLLAFAVGMVWPTLESMKAIESKGVGDDTQWLMYWVCYSTLLSIEQLAWGVLVWIPFYRIVRVVAMAWLALPQTRGATMIYSDFVRPFLLVAVEKAKQLPALEPYACQFLSHEDFEVLKREAVAKVEETIEKAKQQAAASAEGEAPLAYQPLKSHAQ
ncbi:receptor expression-enhancing 5-like isoform X1 isoform A [Micractinium conductrix]|uniref:HVA22-like protein n=1 Tax=Micractinium conductrix TaxID=554055 RepID=A0A2P6V3W8_9CHLO|nr:receptor expression-enhancing 5-like isoform X1 [Micractinium conductrix]PSC68791.1 receptor expression-enhancing 5-like isoform X1 isoform A [Micractinium conductrix]|eukprot:PSC68780.1 receptor expression-enhancing 5-like isoform X1 [Micractinium conductrix]